MTPATREAVGAPGFLHLRLEEVLRIRDGNQISTGCPAKMFQELGKEIFLRDDHPDVAVRA
ncbi:MAG: hypothetical protein LLF90_11465 [Methanomicrobiaceae archaeon]|nr:hypothetical protein [Methanomicrobiaceae archaeon]